MQGLTENMNKMELLDKTHPVGIIPLLHYVIVAILIPYLVSHLPKWTELLEWIKSIILLEYDSRRIVAKEIPGGEGFH